MTERSFAASVSIGCVGAVIGFVANVMLRRVVRGTAYGWEEPVSMALNRMTFGLGVTSLAVAMWM